ncbi:MAG TPA: hypothetical protein VGN34_18205 [Ktedonobacteraceae bacterium]|jgi:hypothetical protein|nr:hypothetical protein [Ktedonobacteraceae bacterium]
MASNSVSRKPASAAKRRRTPYISGLVVRVLIAIVVSWLIAMIFFVTVVASH